MSDEVHDQPTPPRDLGVTLPELLIGIVLTSLLVTTLSFAIIAVLRQQDNSNGRLNNARSENSVGLWMPADLASASSFTCADGTTCLADKAPAASPCFGTCPAGTTLGGSNAMMLSWSGQVLNSAQSAVVTQTTQVSYRYQLAGTEYQLVRVECKKVPGSVTCRSNVILHALDAPPGGVFTAGVTVPSWIMTVSAPVVVTDTGAGVTDPGLNLKSAQKVVVTINGGGDAAGLGGGQNQINLSAGGTNRTTIDASSVQGIPSLIAARTRCGGSIALVIDESGSIGSNFDQVKAGVAAFATALAGTPVKLTIVPFDTITSQFGDATLWNRPFDMLKQSDTDALATAISGLAVQGGGSNPPRGGTNWEDGLFRTFMNKDGTVNPVIPRIVVFFTDGQPTFSRLNWSASTAPLVPSTLGTGLSAADGSAYSQDAFNRANAIAGQFRDNGTTIIGVGVGGITTASLEWITPTTGYHFAYARNFHYSNNYRWYHVEKRSGSGTTQSPYVWSTDTSATTSTTLSSTKRVNFSAPFLLKRSVTLSANGTVDGATNWTTTSSPTNQSLLVAQNNPNLSDSDGSDGWTGDTQLYSSPYIDTEVSNGSGYASNDSSWSKSKSYTVPYTDSDTFKSGSQVLANLVGGNDNATPGSSTGSGSSKVFTYQNLDTANLYILPDWSTFSEAMKRIALHECGGTLTLQTKLGTDKAPDPFTYQKTAVLNPSGVAQTNDLTVVTTTNQFSSGTFDIGVPEGTYLTIEIQPQNISDLSTYHYVSWACRAGSTTVPYTLVDIPNSTWKGIRVNVAANQAVSCTQTVAH